MGYYTKKFTVVLDIDNTIMTSYQAHQIDLNILKKYNLSYVKIDDTYYVERPHIQTLLDFVFKYFNVIFWTAATRSYAITVLEHIVLKKPGRNIELLLSRDTCNYSYRKYKNMKQLKILWDELKLNHLNEHNTILIDDLYNNCSNQQKNCVWIPPFDIKNVSSIQYNAITPILKYLEQILKYNRIPQQTIYHLQTRS